MWKLEREKDWSRLWKVFASADLKGGDIMVYTIKYMFADAVTMELEFEEGLTVLDAKAKLIQAWPSGKRALTLKVKRRPSLHRVVGTSLQLEVSTSHFCFCLLRISFCSCE